MHSILRAIFSKLITQINLSLKSCIVVVVGENISSIVYMQVHLTGDGTDRIYETLKLGSPVLKDVELTRTEDGEDLTVLTEQKVNKLNVLL